MKYLFLFITLIAGQAATAQLKAVQGNISSEFQLTKQPVFTSFSNDKNDYFVITSRLPNFEKMNTLIVADKNGMITINKEIKLSKDMFDNTFIKELSVIGSTPVVFAEKHNKAEGKNVLTVSTIDSKGILNPVQTPVASMDFSKMSNAGDWYTSLTPDKKHIAVIGINPHQKGVPDLINYWMLDENLKETSKGHYSFSGALKNISVSTFMASDKGDLYIISSEYDKTYTYPLLYKFSPGATPMTIPVMIANPDLKNFSYTCKLNPEGDLLIAGYTQQRKTFSMGDPETNGTWLFNSSKPNEVKTTKIDQRITGLTARDIVVNGDTFYLIGEQYKAEKEASTSGAFAEEKYKYAHNDIFITGFSTDGSKKFEMPLSRKWTSPNLDQELMLATGVIDHKLAVIYNDQASKYVIDLYGNKKLPVAVLITNDGLMESPVQFSKELDVKVSSYVLYPQYFVADNGKIAVLSGNAQSVKTVTFSK